MSAARRFAFSDQDVMDARMQQRRDDMEIARLREQVRGLTRFIDWLFTADGVAITVAVDGEPTRDLVEALYAESTR